MRPTGGMGDPTKLQLHVRKMYDAASEEEAIQIINGVSFENETECPDGVLDEMYDLAWMMARHPFYLNPAVVRAFWEKIKLAPRGHWMPSEMEPIGDFLYHRKPEVRKRIMAIVGRQRDLVYKTEDALSRIRFGRFPSYYNIGKCDKHFLTDDASAEIIALIEEALR